MGRLHDAAAMLHTGIRATKPGHGVNFVCAPVVVLAVFFAAMRGARGPTRDDMQKFLGVDKFPRLPSPEAIPELPVPGSSSAGESESEETSNHGFAPLRWVRNLVQRFTMKAASGNEHQTRDASTYEEEKQPRTSDVLFTVANRMYVSPLTGATKAFQAYKKDVEQMTHQGAEVSVLDFREKGEAEKAVNEFVDQRTFNHIKNLLAPGSVSIETRLLAVCAAFFKGEWKTKFLKHYTALKPFYALKGSESGHTSAPKREGRASPPGERKPKGMEGQERLVEADDETEEYEPSSSETDKLVLQHVPTMFVTIERPPFFVQQNDELTAVGLPYKNPQYVLFLIMPKNAEKLPLLSIPPRKRHQMGFEDTEFPYVEQVIEQMKTMAQHRESVEVLLHLPKFHLKGADNKVDLEEVFKTQLGVSTPFVAGEADFGGIDGGQDQLHIDLFRHAADIEVDESGTVASGAAALSISGRSLRLRPRESFQLHFNKPFMFQLRLLAEKPTEEWSDEGADTDNASEGGNAGPTRRREPEGSAGAVGAKPTSEDDVEEQDIVLFSGNIVDAAAAQS